MIGICFKIAIVIYYVAAILKKLNQLKIFKFVFSCTHKKLKGKLKIQNYLKKNINYLILLLKILKTKTYLKLSDL